MTRTTGGPRRAWGRFVAEGVTIVLGILIALWADAWWAERRERAEEQVMLRQLLAEFEDNATQLDSVLTKHARGMAAATVLLDVARGDVSLDSDSLQTLVFELDGPWTFNPKTGALESIIASGRLGIIRDDDLRVALAGWPGLMEDYTEEELHAGDFVRGPQFEYFSSVLNWADVYDPGGEGATGSLGQLAGDETLASLMAYRWSWFETIQSESNPLITTSARIRERLRAMVEEPRE